MNRIFVGREVGKVDRTKWKRVPMNGNIWLKAKYGEGRVCTRTKTWKRSLKPDWGKPRILFWKAFSVGDERDWRFCGIERSMILAHF